MRIVQLIPGLAGAFYCQNCLRDGSLVRAVRELGHDALMVPLYLPFQADGGVEETAPLFFGGINVYLQQKSALFRRTPRWLDRLLDRPALLRWLARRAKMADAAALGETTLSMLRGEDGRQNKELRRLVEFLAGEKHIDAVVLSNALLAGTVRAIKKALGVPVICMLQDEDGFLDGLGRPYAEQAWEQLRQCLRDVDGFIAVSGYYAGEMAKRAAIPPSRVAVVYPGIDPEGYAPAASPPRPPAIGFLSRLCEETGLGTLVEAFILLKSQARHKGLRLRAAGGRLPEDEAFLGRLRRRLEETGLAGDAEFLPNLDKPRRAAFLQSLTLMSVPARRAEAFGLYCLEAWACGVPVVQPRQGAASELMEKTGGGVTYEPNDAASLADAMGRLLADPAQAARLGESGRAAVARDFTVRQTARRTMDAIQQMLKRA